MRITEEEIAEQVEDFVLKYFDLVEQVTGHHLDFIEENELIVPELDYVKLKRFVDTELNNLKNFDPNIAVGLLGKVYKDVEAITKFMIDFKKRTKISSVIFTRDFLSSVKPYQQLVDELTLTKSSADRHQAHMRQTDGQIEALGSPSTPAEKEEYKVLKRKNVDAMHHYMEAKDKAKELQMELIEFENAMKDEFFGQFEENSEYYLEQLHHIVNVKTYYIDKILWHNAKNSNAIHKFFKDAQIKGDYDMKTFIQYYLRNINISKTSKDDWHSYLQECLEVL